MKALARTARLAEPMRPATVRPPACVQRAPAPGVDEGHDEQMHRGLAGRATQPVQTRAALETGYSDVIAAASGMPAVGEVQPPGEQTQDATIHEHAAQGIQGAGSRLPYHENIQAAFGSHDLSGVRAHLGPRAQAASHAIRAKAYTTGNHVAFATHSPTLHTVAHEATHVLQQRAGVSLKDGVGENGDAYERQADAVADAVVNKGSAESLLGTPAHGETPASPVTQHSAMAVQRVTIGEWNDSVGKTAIGDTTVDRMISSLPIRKALLAKNGKGVTPKDAIWRPALRVSTFETLIGELSANTLIEALTELYNEQKSQIQPKIIEPKERKIPLSFTSLFGGTSSFGGSMPDPMAVKQKEFNVFASDIEKGDVTVIGQYLKFLETSSATPLVKCLTVSTKGKRFVVDPSPIQLLEALQKALHLQEDTPDPITVEVQPLSTKDLAETLALELSDLPEMTPLYNPFSGEITLMDTMHEKTLDHERNTQELSILYENDSLALAIAEEEVGYPLSVEELIEINRIIQTSGTNRELDKETVEKAGKLREKNVELPGGVKLARVEDAGPMLEKLVNEYNEAVGNIKSQKRTPEYLFKIYSTAVEIHQRFIYIHPFSNGNGRVARVLLYGILMAAGIHPYRIDPSNNNYKVMSGMQINKMRSTEDMVALLMAQHIQSLRRN